MAEKSVEQMIRDILSALDDGLVIALESGDDPQGFTAGDLVAPANVLNAILAERRREPGRRGEADALPARQHCPTCGRWLTRYGVCRSGLNAIGADRHW